MKVYIIGTVEEGDRASLIEGGHVPFVDETYTDLPTAIGVLVTMDAVCLTFDWWGSARGQMLQTIAGWLKLKHVDLDGKKVETRSLRG